MHAQTALLLLHIRVILENYSRMCGWVVFERTSIQSTTCSASGQLPNQYPFTPVSYIIRGFFVLFLAFFSLTVLYTHKIQLQDINS